MAKEINRYLTLTHDKPVIEGKLKKATEKVATLKEKDQNIAATERPESTSERMYKADKDGGIMAAFSAEKEDIKQGVSSIKGKFTKNVMESRGGDQSKEKGAGK